MNRGYLAKNRKQKTTPTKGGEGSKEPKEKEERGSPAGKQQRLWCKVGKTKRERRDEVLRRRGIWEKKECSEKKKHDLRETEVRGRVKAPGARRQ